MAKPTPAESFIAADGSLMRLIAPGKAILGSTPDEIEYAIGFDPGGKLFSLTNETPQLDTFISAYYIAVYAVTNQQFARFLSESRPPPGVLNIWIPWRDRIRISEDDTAPIRS
jgi:formylglycine-generating enzyme required for sulfatase activity